MKYKLQNWYSNQINNDQILVDSAQLEILKLFDQFIIEFETNQKNWFNRLTKPISKDNKYGFYIYGEVGRGKSMLMNAFYENLNSNNKIRIHFHEFMDNIQKSIANLKHIDNPLKTIAKNLKKQYKIIFLDEMQVSDIANAMILKSLLTNLFSEKIYLVISSNFAPSSLYLDGLMRSRFISAINLLNEKLNIIEIKGNNDYRLKNQSNNNLFQINNKYYKNELDIIFDNTRNYQDVTLDQCIMIQSRPIPYIKLSKHVIWVDFFIICGDHRSQLDYLELSNIFTWFIIEGITKLNPDNKDIARRFTLLIDILYDNNKKLALSSNCAINDIYMEGEFANEFVRTVSRLQEMQTLEYLNKPPLNTIIET